MSKRPPPANPYLPSCLTRSVASKNPSYSDETYNLDDDSNVNKPRAASSTSNTSKPKQLTLADRSNTVIDMMLSSHVILRNICSATTNNNFFLKSEIISGHCQKSKCRNPPDQVVSHEKYPPPMPNQHERRKEISPSILLVEFTLFFGLLMIASHGLGSVCRSTQRALIATKEALLLFGGREEEGDTRLVGGRA